MSKIATPLRKDNPVLPTGSLTASNMVRLLLSHPALLPAMVVLALAIRLALIPQGSFQVDTELMGRWAQRLTTESLLDFYTPGAPATPLPGELWILWAAASLYRLVSSAMPIEGFPLLFALKMIPVIADVGIGLVLFLLGRGFAGRFAGLLAAALYLFNPAPIFIASVWGQWDSVGLFCVLLGLWFFLRSSTIAAAIALIFAVLVKPQFVLLLPVFMLAFAMRLWRPATWDFAFGDANAGPSGKRVAWLRWGLGAFATAAAAAFLLLPFGIGVPPLQTRWSLWERLVNAWDIYPYSSVNAFNLWATPLAGIGRQDDQINLFAFSDRLWGQVFLAVACIAVLVNLWRHGGDRALLWACLAMTLAMFVLPTRVHERYLLPALGFAALAAAVAPGMRWIFTSFTLILFGNVIAVYRIGHTDVGLPILPEASPWVAAASVLCVCVLAYLFLRGREVIVTASPATLAGEVRALIDMGSPASLARFLGPEAPIWAGLILAVPVVVVGLSLTVGLRQGAVPYVDSDYWWHLATGEWILDHRAIPTSDPFSWTHGGQGWIAHEWFADIVLAIAVRDGGFAGAIVLTAIIAIAGFWRLLAGVRAYGMSRRAICLLMLLWSGPFVRGNVMTIRPQLWSFALLAVLLAALAEYETGRRRTLWILPVLFAVWINVNLSALIGIACLGAFALDRLLRRCLERHLFIAAALSVVALLANPRGPELITAALEYGNQEAWRYHAVFEWKPPQLSEPLHLGFLFALPLVPIGIAQIVRGRVWPAVPLLVLAYESFIALRFIPLYMMVAFIFAGWLVWKRVFDAEPLPVWNPLIPRTRWSAGVPAIAAVAVIAIAATTNPSQLRREPLPFGFPEAAASIILEDYPGARIFNVYDYGGYLIHYFYGENLVYVDGREEMYGEPFMQRYWDLINGEPGWQDTFEKAGITVALVRPEDSLYYRLAEDPNWRRVYADDISGLYVREP